MASQLPDSNGTGLELQVTLLNGTRRTVSTIPSGIDILKKLNPADRVDAVKQLLKMRADVLRNSADGVLSLSNSVNEQNAEIILKQYLSYDTVTAFESQNFGEVKLDHHPTLEEQLFGCALNWLSFFVPDSTLRSASNDHEALKLRKATKMDPELHSTLREFTSSCASADDWEPDLAKIENHSAPAAKIVQKSLPSTKSTEKDPGTQKFFIDIKDETIPVKRSHRPWNLMDATKGIDELPTGVRTQSKEDQKMMRDGQREMKYHWRDRYNGRLPGQVHFKPKNAEKEGLPGEMLKQFPNNKTQTFERTTSDERKTQQKIKKTENPGRMQKTVTSQGAPRERAPTGIFFMSSGMKINFDKPAKFGASPKTNAQHSANQPSRTTKLRETK